jgi:hypothetical protein
MGLVAVIVLPSRQVLPDYYGVFSDRRRFGTGFFPKGDFRDAAKGAG